MPLTLEIPTPSDPVGPVVPETPTVPADPVPGPEAPDTPDGPGRAGAERPAARRDRTARRRCRQSRDVLTVSGPGTGFDFLDTFDLGVLFIGLAVFAAVGALSHQHERAFSASLIYLGLGAARRRGDRRARHRLDRPGRRRRR